MRIQYRRMTQDIGTTESDADELIPAAVIVPIITERDGRRLLFTRRAPDLDTHPGQMSFPGGRKESVDATLRDTALRETEEEIGVGRSEVDIDGRLEPIQTVTGFHVEPFIGQIPAGPFTPQQAEVAEVVTFPVDAFLVPSVYEQERREHPVHGTVIVHYFHLDEYTVWGATARILVQYLELTADWTPPSS